MATQFTARLRLPYWQKGDRDWHVQYAQACAILEELEALASLAVRPTEDPSTTLNVAVAPGTFIKSDGTLVTYAGTASQALTTAATNYLYLTDAGVLTVNSTGFPAATFHVPLATVTTDATTVTAITRERIVWSSVGKNLNTLYLPLTGGTFVDTGGVVTVGLGATNGTIIGATGDKLAFLGATPIARPANTVDIVVLLSNLGLRVAGGNPPLNLGTGAITCGAFNVGGLTTVTDGQNIAVGTTTGTKVGTAAAQKLGKWGAAPIVQPASANQAALAALTTVALTNSTTGTATTTLNDVGGSYTQATLNNNFATLAVQHSAVLADLAALRTLVNQLRADLVAAGNIKGSA